MTIRLLDTATRLGARATMWTGAAVLIAFWTAEAAAQGAKAAAPSAKPAAAPAKPAAAAKPAPAAPRYSFKPQACQGRKVLVFDDARSNLMALDGMVAWITIIGKQRIQHETQDEGPALVEALKKAGCVVEHWREPAVSIDVSDARTKWVLLGKGQKEEYKPIHSLQGDETKDYDLVVALRQGQEEHTKTRQNEPLNITFKSEADVQARSRDKVALDGSWIYTEETGLSPYAGYTEKQAAEERVRAEGAAKKNTAEEDFRKKLEDAVRAALAPAQP